MTEAEIEDLYAAIQRRYEFELPDFYRTLHSEGAFSSNDRYLAFFDCEWLTLRGIAEYEFYPWQHARRGGLVPFAVTGLHEAHCWRLDWAPAGEPPIVLLQDGGKAVCLAPNLCGYLYRLTIEAFAGRNDFAGDADVEDFCQTVDYLMPHFPHDWALRLMDLRRREWVIYSHRETRHTLSQAECDEVLATDLAFAQLDEVFVSDDDPGQCNG